MGNALCLILWSVALLSSGYLGERLNADEPAPLPIDRSNAPPDSFRSEEVDIATENHRLAATLYLPVSPQPTPAIVFVHGAGPAVRSDAYQELARHFAQHGVSASFWHCLLFARSHLSRTFIIGTSSG